MLGVHIETQIAVLSWLTSRYMNVREIGRQRKQKEERRGKREKLNGEERGRTA